MESGARSLLWTMRGTQTPCIVTQSHRYFLGVFARRFSLFFCSSANTQPCCVIDDVAGTRARAYDMPWGETNHGLFGTFFFYGESGCPVHQRRRDPARLFPWTLVGRHVTADMIHHANDGLRLQPLMVEVCCLPLQAKAKRSGKSSAASPCPPPKRPIGHSLSLRRCSFVIKVPGRRPAVVVLSNEASLDQ